MMRATEPRASRFFLPRKRRARTIAFEIDAARDVPFARHDVNRCV
jgi:hypothetical protein